MVAAGRIIAYPFTINPFSEDSVKIDVGCKAPDFTLKSDQNQDISLAFYCGSKSTILAFFPFAFTGG